ncbi:amino acid ABC transporter membrane protein 1, PAAT family (TC 3.A.1.3.-) [Propionispira arboris]|uniref:Amino acid ABC transporter membrane protein 1, PAAT family (TC 3.A.1.3.-) n=1 Tax=Propionispira arboris TaxID=84035 RepID=A0A1H7ANV7_9FIRM|nr:amino acid ABC transporter permease [Propionispira arboris]SEJ67341.1 amino acid ABC transporter membrane protein 1, PAAT family (TC 3.A.1.3.-) [Propionispira arboris]
MRPFSLQFLVDVFPILLPFLSATLAVVVGTIFFGSIAGGLLAWAKEGSYQLFQRLAQAYTYIIRCTPPIVLLFIVFYGLPKFCLEVLDTNINDYDKLFFVIISFTLLFAAPVSEVMRSAYEAIDHGQYEAAVSIGLSPWQAFFHIVLPQATVVALPNFGNSVISLMKDGSLAYTIGFIDLIGKGQLIVSMNYGAYAMETYLALALIYLMLTIGMEKLFLWIEQRFSRHKQAA